jgi:selenide,water dikinase
MSDVWAMGGRPIFALNICAFPSWVDREILSAILVGADAALAAAGAALLGGHSVSDDDLKFGLAVVGVADPVRLLARGGARPGDRLILTKPIGTGVLINAFRASHLDAAGLEPALVEMERFNDVASRLALEHGAHAATDVTGFGLGGHALGLARSSGVGLLLRWASVPRHDAFRRLHALGVSTGCTAPNREHVGAALVDRAGLDEADRALLFDPQTSGGLLIAVPDERATALLEALLASGHRAATIGEVVAGESRLEIV